MAKQTLYAWDTWLDPRLSPMEVMVGREVPPGTDLEKVRRQVYAAASKRGVSVNVKLSKAGDVLTIATTPRASSGPTITQFLDGRVHRIPPTWEPQVERYQLYQELLRANSAARPVMAMFDKRDRTTLVVWAKVVGAPGDPTNPFLAPMLSEIFGPNEIEMIQTGETKIADYELTEAETAVVLGALGWPTVDGPARRT